MTSRVRAHLASFAPAAILGALLAHASSCVPDFAAREDILGPSTSSTAAATGGSGGSGAGGAGGIGGGGGAEPTCTDGVRNGGETGVDCGGNCRESDGKLCPLGQGCSEIADCDTYAGGSGGTGGGAAAVVACEEGVCVPPLRAEWTQIPKTGAWPAPRSYSKLLHFGGSGGPLVLLGGDTLAGPPALDFAWLWNGTAWTENTQATAPYGLIGLGFAYDRLRQRALAHGGFAGLEMSDTTTEFDGQAFTTLAAGGPPVARQHHALVYDEARDEFVLFGGAGPASYNDTWTWSPRDEQWLDAAPLVKPSARNRMAFAYHAETERTLVFGGNSYTSDTWAWDGTVWLDVSPAISPPGRSGSAMAYDRARRRTILFGGELFGNFANDTWEWDGQRWIEVLPAAKPPSRLYFALAWNETRKRLAMFGGGLMQNQDDFWEYRAWANACQTSADCDAEATCIDGLCCETGGASTCGTCQACNVDPASAGSCAMVPAGATDADTCSGACDGAGSCVP